MPPVKMRGDGRMAANPKKTLGRLFSYLFRYKFTLLVVLVCIFLTAFAQTRGSTALGKLVDDHILPMVASGSTDFGPVFRFVAQLGFIFLVGMASSFLQYYGSG